MTEGRIGESHAKIREVLMREWDPIGVRDFAQAQDEYDSYIGRLYSMLVDERATREAIAAHLFDIAAGWMGLGRQPRLVERCDHAAAALVALRPILEMQ
ncbi:MAG: hypothetical protein ACREFD_09700 [Stellaceae bacterium]